MLIINTYNIITYKDGSGELEFKEYFKCYSIFDTSDKKKITRLFFGYSYTFFFWASLKVSLRFIESFFFDLADADNSKRLDGTEIQMLFEQFSSIFGGAKIKRLLSRYANKNSLTKNQLTKNQFLKIMCDKCDEDREEDDDEIEDMDNDENLISLYRKEIDNYSQEGLS